MIKSTVSYKATKNTRILSFFDSEDNEDENPLIKKIE